MVNWQQYFKKLFEQKRNPVVDEENVNAPVNHAPPAIQKRYKRLRREWR